MTTWIPLALGAVLVAYLSLDAVLTALRGWRGSGRLRFADRWDAVSRTLGTAAMAVLLLVVVQWIHLPVALWYLVVVLVAAALSGAVRRWPQLPWRGGDGAASTRRASALGGVVFLVFALSLAVFALVL
ncbi:hypothetical protein ACFWTE_00115 [Nocardiopsis sp. NPDC058631]|uniref:hypothetical protein n=1 Tax=Nocardiopsis sp. NPDC058631 TaxID=3346566 RepID=UPI00364AFEEC